MRASWLALLAIAALSVSPALADAPRAGRIPPRAGSAGCVDALALAGLKAPGSTFLGCERVREHGLRALRLRYGASGATAAEMEARLSAHTGMPALRYACCGWETAPVRPGGSVSGVLTVQGVRYEVTMTSGETPVSDRARWPEIPRFSVVLTRFLEEP